MYIGFANTEDFEQLALMKWLHGEEDDIDYGENNIGKADKQEFVNRFISFLKNDKQYRIFVAKEKDKVLSAIFVHEVNKIPKPNKGKSIMAYITNVYTLKEYRGQGIGKKLMDYILQYLKENSCELAFLWPSDKSVKWYEGLGFSNRTKMLEKHF